MLDQSGFHAPEFSDNHYIGFEDFIVMMTTEGKYVPWTPSQTDLLTEDWILI